MADPKLSTQVERITRATGLLFPARSIDLKTAAATHNIAYNVTGKNRCSIQVNPTTWSTAVVDLYQSVDGATFVAFGTPVQLSTATPRLFDVDIQGAAFVKFVVTTNTGAASTDGICSLYAYLVHV